jgi:peptidase E
VNIYVTSYGIDVRHKKYMNSYDEIINLLKNKNVAIICNAKLKTQDRTNSITVKEELNNHNIFADIIDLDEKRFKIKKYNAIYFSGGEPKFLMDSIINNGYKNAILEFINNGNIIIGQSAGAMIMSKRYVDTSIGSVKILDNGFNIFNKIIIPHYDSLDSELLKLIPSDVFKIKDNDNLIRLI